MNKIIIIILAVLLIPLVNALDIDKINTLANSNNHQYIKVKYDCTQFAKDLKVNLRKEGYNAWCIYGRINGQLHNWVMIKDGRNEIFVEATPYNQGIIDKDDYISNYHEIERGVCK